jgi:hypothetical protein
VNVHVKVVPSPAPETFKLFKPFKPFKLFKPFNLRCGCPSPSPGSTGRVPRLGALWAGRFSEGQLAVTATTETFPCPHLN